MFLLHNSLFNVVASVSSRSDFVMILYLLLISRTHGMLVPIHSQKRCFLFDQLNHLQPSWTALLHFHVRCSSIGETCRCFYNKLLFHEHFIYAGVYFWNFLHHFKIKKASIDDKKLVSYPE